MPTGRSGQLLAVALLLAVLGVAYLLAVVPLLNLYSDRAAALQRDRMLAPRLSAIGAELPALRSRLAALGAQERARKVTLDGASDAIASANLQSRIDALANSVGATVGSTEALPAKAEGPYRRIGIRVVLSGSYETLVRLIASLEDSAPPLVLDNLQLHGILLRPGPATVPRIDAGLDVYGFRAAGPAIAHRS